MSKGGGGVVDRSMSQSLFNIYYLGQTRVDRRCNASMMPWIIEELKLKAGEMRFIWLSPGPEGVTFVADNGQELFKHSYGNILHCCIAMDGISFAYAARQEKDKYFCHVFQALTYEEASKIMTEFKEHAQEEVTVPPTITHNHSTVAEDGNAADMKSSGFIMSSLHNGGLPREEEYKLEYWGRYEVPAPASSNTDQVMIIDTLVSKYRDAMFGKFRSKKRSFGAKFSVRKDPAKSLPNVSSTEAVDSLSTVSSTSLESEGDSPAQHKAKGSNDSSDSSDISITLTPSSPPPVPTSEGDSSVSPEDPADHHTSMKQSNPVNHSESSDFDTLPELASLKSTTEFQALSLKGSAEGLRSPQKVRLLFSGTNVVVVTDQTEDIVLRKSIRNIACCAQGKKENDFFAFTSRHKELKKYFCYLFMAKNSRKAIKVLESFKSAFVHALALSLPPAVCEYCPYKQIQQLCKNLEGVSTQVAQSRLQECLSTLAEADYNQIMLDYKSSEHADHEYTQIIVLVALLRQHFQRKQEKHTHRGLLPHKPQSSVSSSRPPPHPQHMDTTTEEKLNVPALTRAKIAIANSFENLRSKPLVERKRKNSQDKLHNSKGMGRKAESLNMRATSPLFARKTSIDTLMAPVTTSPRKDLPHRRERSWTAGVDKVLPDMPVAATSSASDSQLGTTEEQKDQIPGHNKTPHRITLPKKGRSLHRERHTRHSLTPPSVAAVDKYLPSRGHRRSSSNIISKSWRQEIFDSVSTPTKLEGGFHRADSDSLDEWQVIEYSSQNDGTWKETGSWKDTAKDSPRTRARKRWKDAIQQQILLNRMEKENQLLKKEGKKQLKLHYSSKQPESSEALSVWKSFLQEPDRHYSTQEIHSALLLGVPPSLRGEVWHFLSQLFQAKHKPDWEFPAELCEEGAFYELGQQETEYEHSITVDLGRTFPSQPYFAGHLQEAGQSDLHHVLHGYAVADPETGYCQGLSFVTGLILMHTKDETTAFNILYKLMNLHEYKEIYRGSLSNLQVRLYQLSRLMHDYIPALHQLLQQNEVTPFYYAAPWFLTIFASQYPISFTARVFDLIFYEGTEILFKVALSLLKVHEAALLKCKSMESICTYLKTTLPAQAHRHEETILKQALQFEFEGKLQLFETEYKVIDELNARFSMDMPVDIESLTATLRKNNSALVEQLAICFGSIISLQQQVDTLQEQVLSQQQVIARLESDKRDSTESRTSNLND